MADSNDDFSISIGDDVLAEALQAVEKRLYKSDGTASEEPELLIPGGLGDLDDDLEVEVDMGGWEDDSPVEGTDLKQQLISALEKNARLEQEVQDMKDESRRLATKVKRLSDSNAQLKLDVRDAADNLKTWQDMVTKLKAAASEAESAQSSLRTKHKRELDEASSAGLMKSFKMLLTPIDHIELSFQHLGEDLDKDSPMHGLKMSFEELQRALEKIQLVKVEAAPGVAFDPEMHEAIARESNKDFQPNQITQVHRAGYRYGKRLLRAAQVTVCSDS